MSAEPMDDRVARLNALSDRLFGEAAEVDVAEAERLLRTAGIDPAKLKADLYQRMRERSESYSRAGKPLPSLLKQALEDLEPLPERSETALTRTARHTMTRLLEEIRELSRLLAAGPTPVFTASYRNRKELSAGDINVLDGVAEDLRKRIEESKTHE